MIKKPFIRPGKAIPEGWEENSWDEKARENPLYAVMTVPELSDADPSNFSAEQLDLFFKKGRALYSTHIKPLVEAGTFKSKPFIVEYGCGMGRILKAAVDEGYKTAGIDISETMIEHCRKLVSGVDHLYLLDDDGRCALADSCADIVYSYAVLQHIESLEKYTRALNEICRILKPEGTLAIQVNCEDFINGWDQPDRTENFETYSLHYKSGESTAYWRHKQTTWSGVYIGEALLLSILRKHGVTVNKWYYHSEKKRRAVWAVGRKQADAA